VTDSKRRAVPSLLYRDDLGNERVYQLEQGRPLTIGRGDDVDLRLGWDRSVSLVHAETVPLGAGWLISDEHISRNGTFLNSERLTGRRRLRHGDVIRVGRTELVFNDRSAQPHGATTIVEGVTATRTLTFLFTDLVGSTDVMDRLGDDAGDRVRAKHFGILRKAVVAHEGREVKSLGDGLMVAFASSVNGITCAKHMQQQIAEYNRAHEASGEVMGLRVGLNAGEVISAEGDYFGTPVVLAKRLCDRAQPGQCLSSDVVRALVGSRGEHRFEPLGILQLKGFATPVSVYDVKWC
jgi:class 3 adenylate cyclase